MPTPDDKPRIAVLFLGHVLADAIIPFARRLHPVSRVQRNICCDDRSKLEEVSLFRYYGREGHRSW